MMWLKACPKCSGDLFLEWGLGDSQVACLQCGRTLSEAELGQVRAAMARRARRVVAERQRELVAKGALAPLPTERPSEVTIVQ